MLQQIGHRADLLGTGVTGIGTLAEPSCALYSRLATWKGKVALCLPTLWFECLLQVPLVSFLSGQLLPLLLGPSYAYVCLGQAGSWGRHHRAGRAVHK